MKQKVILQILAALLSIYNFMYMPLQTSSITLLGALALYGLTNELLIPVFVLFISPLIVFSVKAYKSYSEGFQSVTQQSITDRIESMKKKADGFQDTPAVDAGSDSVSVPAFVSQMGNRIVIPNSHDTPMESVDVKPKTQRALITGADTQSVNAALASDLGDTDQQAVVSSMSVGPSSL